MIRFLSTFVAFLSIASIYGQQNSQNIPKLVIGITIDQLRGDYLEAFSETFGDKGFKRLLNNGLVYSDIKYNFPKPDRASAVATIFTGSYPFYHGIVGESKYLPDSDREVSVYTDNKFIGNNTRETLSPLSLKVSTITDELKIASGGQSEVYSFAPYESEALASGGHAANAAYWIDDQTGKWASSSFYTTKQPLIDQHNRSAQSLSKTAHSTIWRPALDITRYNAFPYTRNIYNFQHVFGAKKGNSVRLLKQSPYVNTEVRQMAEKVLNGGSVGKRTNPDFIALTFYAGNFEDALDKNYSIEIQDIYYKLDQEIAQLLETIENTVGLENTLIFVASTGYFNELEIYPESMTLSGGEFRPDRSQALLNMYLMAVYGRHQWIKKYFNNQIYFDHKLIEDNKLSIGEFQNRAAEFLVQSAGIQDVITSQQMLHGAYNNTVQFFRNGYHKGISGDLIIEFQPGWKIINGESTDHQPVRNNAVSAPVIFFGNNIKPQIINRTIEATEIAPSITHRLRIRAPNAASSTVLKELF